VQLQINLHLIKGTLHKITSSFY